MSNVKILIKTDVTLVQVLTFDVTLSHNIKETSTVTEHPVEGDKLVADNVRTNSLEITLTGYVSDYPTAYFGLARPTRDDSRGTVALKELRALKSLRARVQIHDELDIYHDMVLVSFDIPRDVETHTGLKFTAVFRHVVFVGVTETVLKDENTTKDLAAPEKDRGKQVAEDAEPKDEQRASYLLQLIRGAGFSVEDFF